MHQNIQMCEFLTEEYEIMQKSVLHTMYNTTETKYEWVLIKCIPYLATPLYLPGSANWELIMCKSNRGAISFHPLGPQGG